MPNVPKHPTLNNMVQYYISMYYHYLKEIPVPTHEDKIQAAETANKNYLQQLSKKYSSWETQEAKDAVKAEIDFLTGIYKKQKADQEKESRRDKIRELFK